MKDDSGNKCFHFFRSSKVPLIKSNLRLIYIIDTTPLLVSSNNLTVALNGKLIDTLKSYISLTGCLVRMQTRNKRVVSVLLT